MNTQALVTEIDPADPRPCCPALDNAQGLPGLAGQGVFHFYRGDMMY